MQEIVTYHCNHCSLNSCVLLKDEDEKEYNPEYCHYGLCSDDWQEVETKNIDKELDTLKAYCQREILKETELWQAVKSIFAKVGKEW
jgi:hypothetical protein